MLSKFLFSQGDSGGPIIVNNEVFGVISHGAENCVQYPASAVKVAAFQDWIETYKQQNKGYIYLILAGTLFIAITWLVMKISHQRKAKNTRAKKHIVKKLKKTKRN